MPAVALTDHGSLAGAIDLVKAAKGQGVKPIIGCEVYVADDRRAQQKGYAHLTLLAQDNEGYSNLIKLSSLGYLEGYYYKPRVDWELLDTHSSGLIALSGLPLRPRLQGARGRPRRRRRGRARSPHDDLRQGRRLRRDAERTSRRAAAHQPPARAARGQARAADGRDRRRALPPPRGRARPRGAALHPVGRLAEEPEPLEVRHRPLLLQDAGGDARRLPGAGRGAAAHARGRRALQRRDRARAHPAAALPDARRTRPVRLPRRALREGTRRGATTRSRPSCASGSSSS